MMKLLVAMFFMVFGQHCLLPLSAKEPLKVLHLCFHDGCINEINGIAKECDIQLTSWNIHNLPPYFFDPATEGGNKLYNVDHERACRVWKQHKDFFHQFDVIITSDTPALSRIFLQNKWTKPLIIWVTLQFDWSWWGDPDRKFPDSEFYKLLNDAKNKKNVFLAASTPYAFFFAKQKNVDLGDRVIKPCAYYLTEEKQEQVLDALKNKQLFIHKRTEDVQAFHNHSFVISNVLQKLNIPAACYRYNSSADLTTFKGALTDLRTFKGVLYLPYQWCQISFFETLQLGLPTFVPSEAFLLEMMKKNHYFFEESEYLTRDKLFALAEWYHPDIRNIVIYFDSWKDLQKKFADLDYQSAHQKTLLYGKAHAREMLSRWKNLFNEVRLLK